MAGGLKPGVYAASVTPFKEDLVVDEAALVAHCQWLLGRGCDGLIILGSTGEANSLSVSERMTLVESLVKGGLPAARLVIGTGCCAIPDTVRLTRHAMDVGANGVLMLPPFYYKGVGDPGLFEAFQRVIEQVDRDDLRICLYHFPKMSGVPYSRELIKMLFEAYPDQVDAIKDSSGDWQHMASLIEEFPSLKVFAGSERFLSDNLGAGGSGCITATGNVVSPLAAEIYKGKGGNEVKRLQERVTALRGIIERHSLVPALKEILAQWRNEAFWRKFRPPLETLNDEIARSLNRELREADFDLEQGR